MTRATQGPIVVRQLFTVLATGLTVVSIQGCDTSASTAVTAGESTELVVALRAAHHQDVPTYGPWSAPVNIGPVINSTDGENRPFIGANDKDLFFTSMTSSGSRLMVSSRADAHAPWGAPLNLGPVINTAGNDFSAFLTRDAKSFYFSREAGCGGTDLWVGERHNKHDNTGWHVASNLGCTINSTANDLDAIYVADPTGNGGAIYFMSDRNATPLLFDIYVSSRASKHDAFGPAVPVPELNSSANDRRIVMRRDGLEAFISSNRAVGSGGLDIWVSTRASTDAPWGTPVNLGPVVNSSLNDFVGSISDDGMTLYFDSQARAGGLGGRDVWVSTRVRTN